MTYDLIIIGGGPAGTAAAVYASRKRLKTFLIIYCVGRTVYRIRADLQLDWDYFHLWK